MVHTSYFSQLNSRAYVNMYVIPTKYTQRNDKHPGKEKKSNKKPIWVDNVVLF